MRQAPRCLFFVLDPVTEWLPWIMLVHAATTRFAQALTTPGELEGKIGTEAADLLDLIWDRLDTAAVLGELLDRTRTMRVKQNKDGDEVAYVDLSDQHRLVITPTDNVDLRQAQSVSITIKTIRR